MTYEARLARAMERSLRDARHLRAEIGYCVVVHWVERAAQCHGDEQRRDGEPHQDASSAAVVRIEARRVMYRSSEKCV